jgi:NRPS condensation-like uncharacterized protein
MMVPENVEGIYALSPLQHGILFHTLYAPGSGEYFEQFCCPLEGRLDADAFERAWQQVVDRHPALRTAFVWEKLGKPVQVVHQSLKLPVERLDWRDLAEGEQRRRLGDVLEADRERGFELTRAPLMRLTLIRTGEARHELVWSFHHLLLDGWSASLAMSEVLAFYRAFSQGSQLRLEQARPFRDYIAWL